MKRLNLRILSMILIVLMISCVKNYDPPALGDHTVPEEHGTPGTLAGKKVLNLGADWGDIFRTGPNGILYVRNKDKVFKVYKPDDSGVFGSGTSFPGNPWDASANLYYMGVAQNVQTVMIVNTPPAGLFRFNVGTDGLLTMHPTTNPADPWPNNFGFWYGDGWNKYDIIASNGKFVFQIDHSQGETLLRSTFQQFTDDWSTWNRQATLKRDDTGKKFGEYRSAMSMGNSLLVVTKTGDLMAYAVDDNGNLDNGKTIGVGWEIFDKVISTGNDLLAINRKGQVYRYVIDLTKTNNNTKF